MPDREGQRLGNYRLIRLLGKGAFAEVYLGEHLYLKNYAAIKLLLTSINEKDEQSFFSEAQTLAQLSHPNIVRIRDFAVMRGIPFLAMDYAPGGMLRQRHPRGSCLSLDLTVTYIKQIAAALQYAHNHGIIHRDVKPENVLLGQDQVMLTDFGISLHLPSVSKSGLQGWAGTLPYIAPEQLQGRAVYASDQYALAVMAYEWLCGVRPFEGDAYSLAYHHIHTPPPRLRDKDPSLPAAVENVILKALSKDPADRYVSIITFARALERVSRASVPGGIDTLRIDLPAAPHLAIPRRVFLSHAPADDVSRFKSDLETRDVIVADSSSTSQTRAGIVAQVPGQQPEEALRQAIRAAQIVLLVVSPQTRSSPEVKEHLRVADIYRRPVRYVWAAGDDIRELLPVRTGPAVVIDARGPRYRQALDEIMGHLERERGLIVATRPAEEPAFEPRNPYKGLHAFTQQDRADFFGRDALIQEMVQTIRTLVQPEPPGTPGRRLLALVGPSGSGKSSIAMAGLLPRLQDGAIPGSESWLYLNPLTPGKQPLAALAHTLAARFSVKGMQPVQEMLGRAGSFGLHQIALALAHQGTRLVLFIDQFEELFSPDVAEQERQRFIDLLVTAAVEPRGPTLVLLTLRADFYDRPLAYSALGRLIQQNQCAVLPMEVEDLRSVIERPALQPDVRLIFEEDLVGDLLYEIRGQAGALPLLEFTLDRLFHHRRGHLLTRHAYQEIGGVRGALARHAENTYAALPSEEHRRLTRALFARLIQPAATGQEPMRRRADLLEFSLENEEQTRLLRGVIDAFVAARLLTVNQDASGATLEVSHEALLREWPRLADWTREAGEDIRLQQAISSDVAEWERRGKPRDRLYRGTQLKESLTWLERNIASSSEAAFLRASTRRRKRERINLLVVACLILSLLIPAGVLLQQALTPPTVTTLQDGGKGSLRQLIEAAKPGSTIYFASGLKGRIGLTRSLEINKSIIIRGPGANLISIGSAPGQRVDLFLISILHGANVTFSGLTFRELQPYNGSLISNEGTLTLSRCSVTGNIETGIELPSTSGENTALAAAISNHQGTLNLQNSIITKNAITTGVGVGGAIANDHGTLTLTNSQITDNTVRTIGGPANQNDQIAGGGGIYSSGGKVTLTNSTISGNTVTGGNPGAVGGGIFSTHDMLTIASSVIASNAVTSHGGVGGGGGIIGYGSTITLINSRVTNNALSADKGATGGGIAISDNGQVNSTLKLIGSSVTHNTVNGHADLGLGGGISVFTSNATLINSQVTNNSAISNDIAAGGGIEVEQRGSITLTGSAVSDNTISAPEVHGGGISSLQAQVTMTGTIVQGNIARGGPGENMGGGIAMNGTLTISNSLIAHNLLTSAHVGTAGALGGGIDVVGTLDLGNSTIASNTVKSSAGISYGGGILIVSPSTTGNTRSALKLTNCTIYGNTVAGKQGSIGGGILDLGAGGTIDFCTIYGNSASTEGGGLFSNSSPNAASSTLKLKNTLIAGNTAAKGPDVAGKITTEGYNLVQRFSGAQWNDPDHRHATDHAVNNLATLHIDTQLRSSGTAVPTLALLPGSPALNQIPAAFCDASTDQRGVKRPQQNACDIGAYEYAP
ncbi:MAG TPA: protein kinase [Ktedonobacteraceae bacterium]|nr:protein kinase [Ktedonobacteraceae bacterium]